VRIYVGNLSYDVEDQELRSLFEPYGEVASASVIKDRYTGNSKGFGFVEMATNEAGQKAVKELRGKEYRGRTLNIDEARPPAAGDRPGGGGGGHSRGPRPGGGGGRGGPRRGGGGGGYGGGY
jgi:RNA recognition motif-containing protein